MAWNLKFNGRHHLFHPTVQYMTVCAPTCAPTCALTAAISCSLNMKTTFEFVFIVWEQLIATQLTCVMPGDGGTCLAVKFGTKKRRKYFFLNPFLGHSKNQRLDLKVCADLSWLPISKMVWNLTIGSAVWMLELSKVGCKDLWRYGKFFGGGARAGAGGGHFGSSPLIYIFKNYEIKRMPNLGKKNSGGVWQFLPSDTFGQTHPRVGLAKCALG